MPRLAPLVALSVVLALWSCAHAGGGTVLLEQTYRSPLFGPFARGGGALFYAVYLPHGYDGRARRYPVIYLLHGSGGRATDWLKEGGIKTRADRLIAQRKLPPSILVLPHDTNIWTLRAERRFGSLEQLLTRDLVRHIDATYRTVANRAGRTIAGVSFNGYSALYLALKRPDIYAAGASLGGPFWGPEVAASATANPMLSWFFGDLERAAKHNIFDLIARRPHASTRLLLLCGDDDAFLESTVRAYLALKAAGVDAELRVTGGTHGWATWCAAAAEVLVFLGAASAP